MKTSTVVTVEELAQLIVNKYVRLLSTPSGTDASDRVFTYSSEVITLGLLWEDFHDAIREGDGEEYGSFC